MNQTLLLESYTEINVAIISVFDVLNNFIRKRLEAKSNDFNIQVAGVNLY